jgi:hypothetical protein
MGCVVDHPSVSIALDPNLLLFLAVDVVLEVLLRFAGSAAKATEAARLSQSCVVEGLVSTGRRLQGKAPRNVMEDTDLSLHDVSTVPASSFNIVRE